jgi:hypothetical protein
MHVGITTQKVSEVYERAFSHFADRRGESKRALISDREAIRARPNPSGPVAVQDVPLNGFPPGMHRQVRLLETLAWAEHLILYQQQRAIALKLIASAWLRNPLSVLPARVLLRRFLPVSLVARVVQLKHRSERGQLVSKEPGAIARESYVNEK